MGTSTAVDNRSRFPFGPTAIVVSILIGLMGIGLALYFGLKSEGARELQLIVTSEPIIVYDPDVTTSFRLQGNPGGVLWRTEVSPEDHKVWAMNFAIWNGGTVAVKPEHVLSPLQIRIGSRDNLPAVVWELRSLQWSRKEIDFQTLSGSIREVEGSLLVPINFRILEQGDGVKMQLIYSGSSGIPIALEGTVEGMTGNDFLPIKHLQIGRWEWAALISVIVGMFGIATWFIPEYRHIFLEAIRYLFSLSSVGFLFFGVGVLIGSDFISVPEIPNFSYLPPTP